MLINICNILPFGFSDALVTAPFSAKRASTRQRNSQCREVPFSGRVGLRLQSGHLDRDAEGGGVAVGPAAGQGEFSGAVHAEGHRVGAGVQGAQLL